MTRLGLFVGRYDWSVRFFFAVSSYYVGEISKTLANVGCDGDYMRKAVSNMESKNLNHGLCYSNIAKRESVLVVGLTSSAGQFLNSFCHELHHLVQHICQGARVDADSEEASYLAGDIAQRVFPYVVNLLCEHCRRQSI